MAQDEDPRSLGSAAEAERPIGELVDRIDNPGGELNVGDETPGAEAAIEASELVREMPFRTDAEGSFIPGAMRDSLKIAQGQAAGAARLSGERIASLLYGATEIRKHTSPYDASYAPNYGDATRVRDE